MPRKSSRGSTGSGGFEEVLGEAVEPSSYLKSPYWRGLPRWHVPRRPAGPAQRLSPVQHSAADAELTEYRSRGGATVLSSFFFHYARLIEILAALEKIEATLGDEDLYVGPLQATAGINAREGIGASEAPRHPVPSLHGR